MILIWSGRGLWILWALLLAPCAAALAIEYLAVDPGQKMLALYGAIALAGLFCIGLGLQARRSPPRLLLERQTGRELMRRPVHSLYWLRAEYWGLLCLLLSGWLFLSRLS